MIAQGSLQWFEQRRGHVTASRMSDVLAKGKSGEAVTRAKYRMQIIAERVTGQVAIVSVLRRCCGVQNKSLTLGCDMQPLRGVL
jgi:hypothetical protein